MTTLSSGIIHVDMNKEKAITFVKKYGFVHSPKCKGAKNGWTWLTPDKRGLMTLEMAVDEIVRLLTYYPEQLNQQ